MGDKQISLFEVVHSFILSNLCLRCLLQIQVKMVIKQLVGLYCGKIRDNDIYFIIIGIFFIHST
jgi:hypothetical protein